MLKNPMTGLAVCCARAMSDPMPSQTSAPPSPAMNSRRRICNPQGSKLAHIELDFVPATWVVGPPSLRLQSDSQVQPGGRAGRYFGCQGKDELFCGGQIRLPVSSQ